MLVLARARFVVTRSRFEIITKWFLLNVAVPFETQVMARRRTRVVKDNSLGAEKADIKINPKLSHIGDSRTGFEFIVRPVKSLLLDWLTSFTVRMDHLPDWSSSQLQSLATRR